MNNYKILLNVFILFLFLNVVRANDEETTTESAEIILTPGPIVGEYKKKDLNASYDESDSIIIQCSGTSCTTESDSVTINNGNVTISSAGTYVLQGDLIGQVYISATKDDFIHLVLNNMSITSEYGPAIYEVKCDKLVITTVGENFLVDSTNYPVGEDDDDEEEESKNDNTNETTEEDSTKKKSPNACLFTKSDLTFNGEGSISITGNYFEGIRCKKDLKFISGTINVVAVEKGIKAKNSVSIKEAIINVDAVDSGIKVTKDTDPEKGFVVIDGGKITVKSGNDGIHAESHLTINDGYIDVTESKEGLEGQMIDIVGGEIHVKASDDGINASKIGAVNEDFPGGFPGGNFNDTMNPGGFPGGFPGGNFNDTMNPNALPNNFLNNNSTIDSPSQQPDELPSTISDDENNNDEITNNDEIDNGTNEDGIENSDDEITDIVFDDVNDDDNNVNDDENVDNASEDEDNNNENHSINGKNRKNGHHNKIFKNKNGKKGSGNRKYCYVKKVIKKSQKSKTTITKTIYATSVIKNNKPTSTNISSSKKYGSLPKKSHFSSKKNENHFEKRANTENDESVYIKIVGGKVYVYVEGNDVDGIDSNGSLYIGGNAEVYVTNSSGDIYGNMAALDAEGSNVIDVGATVIATAGSSMGGPGGPNGSPNGGPNGNMTIPNGGPNGGPNGNMTIPNGDPNVPGNMTQQDIETLMQNFNQTQNPFGGMGGSPNHENKDKEGHGGPGGMGGGPGNETGTVKQAYIKITINDQDAGTELIVKDSDDNVIITYQPQSSYSKILITSPKLQEGATYTVTAGTETQTAVATIDTA
ncbi:hypothetical protein PIROE2DRAFT_2358 [Piromyces sp. E2]|nr:hypothetical protein PIROE2DRAFT_2358 [Piromyces sp. E2]|eukprot:OUM69718.1 hypothetical protein PIROE2DRAFT_2358 [Piromyces sp. E2]